MADIITVTDKAWERIKAILPQSQDPNQKACLRIKIVGGGCSGLSYKMEFDVEKKGDSKFEHDDTILVVDQKSILYVKGMELDYIETLQQSGFVFKNPNVKHSCGCGQSFNT